MLKNTRWILAAVGLLTIAELAEARAVQKEPQGLSNAQLVQALHNLHAIKLTLEAANHDYGGHRAKAIADITKAQKQLRLALKHAPKGKGKGKVKSLGEPQALSDAQLLEAIGYLKQTEHLLAKANHDYGGHRAATVSDLHQAVRQLELALKFRKAKV